MLESFQHSVDKHSKAIYTCIFGDGKELCLYRSTVLCLRDKTKNHFALQTESIIEIASTTIPASTLHIRLNVQVWPCSQQD